MKNNTTVRIPRLTTPTEKNKVLSKHSTALWMAWKQGFAITEEIWQDYLSSMGVQHFPLSVCMEELRRNGWIAE